MFRHIPRLSKKRALFVALPLVAVACAVLLAVLRRPEDRGIRFRYPDTWQPGYLSLDEPKMMELFHLDLSAFQFPADSPLTIDTGAVYLKVPIDTGQVLIPTDFSLFQNCSPSPDVNRLLCGSPENANILPLPLDQQVPAIAELQDHLVSDKEFFVVTSGIPQIYTIPEINCPNCSFDWKSTCRWADTTRIYCKSPYGSGVWRTSLFDLGSRSYVELPRDGDNIVEDSPFVKGYIYQQTFPYPYPLEVYNLAKAMVFQGSVEDWIASEDTIAYVGPCDEQSYCAGKLELDDNGLKTSRQQVLDSSWSPENVESRIEETQDEYLVTSNGKVFVLSKDTLQVIQTFEYPEAKVERSDPWKTALYRGKDLIVTTTGHPWDLELTGVTAFSPSKCATRLDDSCKPQSWNSVAQTAGGDPSRQAVRHHIYYLPAERPDLLFSIDEYSSRLAVHNLKEGTDYRFELTGVPSVVAISTDGHFLLVGTRVDDDYVLPEDAQYHLFDLQMMRPDPRGLVMRKNLFLAWANAR